MTRHIPYKNKTTTAGTQYRQTTSQDTNWVLEQCKQLSHVAAECEKHKLKEGAALNHPNPYLPKMSTGRRNTPATMCDGVVDNFNQGQYDLSDKQMDGLKEAFRICNNIIEDFEQVEFEEVVSLPKIRSTSAPLPHPLDNTVFGDLFDLSQYEVDTITLRRKQ